MSIVVNNVVKSIFLYRVYHQLQANTFGYPFMAVNYFILIIAINLKHTLMNGVRILKLSSMIQLFE